MTITLLQQLQSTLQAELKSASQLLNLLNDERSALTETNADIMNDMTAKKQPLIISLEQLGRQRENILQAAGFSSGKEGLEAFIENQPEQYSISLNSLVNLLKETAQACKDNNQINGGIVNVNRQHLQKAMNILRGRNDDPSSYGPGGEYTDQVVRQPLLGRV